MLPKGFYFFLNRCELLTLFDDKANCLSVQFNDPNNNTNNLFVAGLNLLSNNVQTLLYSPRNDDNYSYDSLRLRPLIDPTLYAYFSQ